MMMMMMKARAGMSCVHLPIHPSIHVSAECCCSLVPSKAGRAPVEHGSDTASRGGRGRLSLLIPIPFRVLSLQVSGAGAP